MILCLLLWVYACIYPPIVMTDFIDPSVRIAYEFLVLLIIVLYSRLKDPFKVPRDLVWLAALVVLYWLFSQEESRQVFSFFNKYVFLILLFGVIRNDKALFVWLRKTWVAVWLIIPVSAILACLIFALNLAPHLPLRFGNSEYYSYSLLGLVLRKNFGFIAVPRYSWWIVEPVCLGLFFGINVFIARYILSRVNVRRWFIWLNLAGGLLTFSAAFYVFFFIYFLYRGARRCRVTAKIIIFAVCLVATVFCILKNPGLISFTSFADRAERYRGAWDVFSGMQIKQLIFGYGIIPLQDAVGGGTCSGIIDILLGRGLLLLILVMKLLFQYTKYCPALLVFIIYYSMSLNFFTFPLFLLALVLGYEAHRRNAEALTSQKVADEHTG